MGNYVCVANNGIPPEASQKFNVQVHCELLNTVSVALFFGKYVVWAYCYFWPKCLVIKIDVMTADDR